MALGRSDHATGSWKVLGCCIVGETWIPRKLSTLLTILFDRCTLLYLDAGISCGCTDRCRLSYPLAEDTSSFRMACTYYKRYRMEVDLSRASGQTPWVPRPYRYVPWNPRLLGAHAEAKFLSFRHEIDAVVFPCLGDFSGCHRLMREISLREGFVPQATWLIVHQLTRDVCGTIQGVRSDEGWGSIQNIGVVPGHRKLGLGAGLIHRALAGFRQAGLLRAYLEVTSDNIDAIRLYKRLGFREAQTVYKVAEIAYT